MIVRRQLPAGPGSASPGVGVFRWSVAAAIAFSSVAAADPWLPPGSPAIRHDITLLADVGLIHAPVTPWPMSWPDIARDVLSEEPRGDLDVDLAAALARVQRLARRALQTGFLDAGISITGAAKPARLRTFAESPREEGEVAAGARWLGNRWAVSIRATAVVHPDDGQELRLDGSYAGVALGNLMISAGAIDKWWGPGWEGSLLLSTNARPIPGVTIERKLSEPSQWWGLRWVGPWRATVSMGQLEGGDVAVPDARFFAARVNFRPRSWLEFGLSRTAQWCGRGRPCDLDTVVRLIAGQDNRDGPLEPGNQVAGYNLRLVSPWRALPVAVYGQFIGEDEAGGLPGKFLGLMGAETWRALRWGSFRLHAEYADTSCNFARHEPLFGCAYRNRLYPQGYTFRGRIIGHALDSDGRMSLGALLLRPSGASWTLLARRAELNRGCTAADPLHTVSRTRDQLKNLELQYNRPLARGELGVGLSLDDFGGSLR